jgi:hypothetical protein
MLLISNPSALDLCPFPIEVFPSIYTPKMLVEMKTQVLNSSSNSSKSLHAPDSQRCKRQRHPYSK